MGVRRLGAVARVGARRAIIRRAFTGGALAATALAGYGAYRGIKRIRAARARVLKRRRLGHPMRGVRSKKRVVTDVDTTGKATRTLYQEDLTNIPKGTTADQREYDVVNVRGWKMQINVESLRTVPIQINFAVLGRKNGAIATTLEFFRGYGDDRSVDFSTTLNFLKLMQSPINTDHYEVLHRWNVKLGALQNFSGGTAEAKHGVTAKEINKYIPFKRQLRYDNTGNDPEAHNMLLVYWADVEYNAGSSTATANSFNIQIRNVAYFRDAH